MEIKKILLFLILMSCLYCPVGYYIKYNDFYYKIWDSVLIVESNSAHFDEKGTVKVSHKGAVGKAQIMTNTFLWVRKKSRAFHLTLSDITNEAVNVWAGEWYFNYLFYNKHSKNHLRAISSYNCGGDSQKYMTNYVKKVLKNIDFTREAQK